MLGRCRGRQCHRDTGRGRRRAIVGVAAVAAAADRIRGALVAVPVAAMVMRGRGRCRRCAAAGGPRRRLLPVLRGRTAPVVRALRTLDDMWNRRRRWRRRRLLGVVAVVVLLLLLMLAGWLATRRAIVAVNGGERIGAY